MATLVKTSTEKRAMESKKFLSWLIGSLRWDVLFLVTLAAFSWYGSLTFYATVVLCALVFTRGSIDGTYLLGVAWLDRYSDAAKTGIEAAGKMAHKVETEVQNVALEEVQDPTAPGEPK